MGAVPVQEAKWSRSGNRVMSPTSTSSRAAPEGPMPCRSSQRGAGRGEQLGQFLVRRPSCARRSARGRRSARRRPGGGSCRRRRGAGPWPAAPWPGRRTGPSSRRRGSARAAAGAAGRPSGCGPHPATRRRSTRIRSTASCSSSTTGRSPAHPGADQRDGVRVGGVGLAALPGGEHPRPGRQLRRHVDDLLAVGQQPHARCAGRCPLQPSIAHTRSGHCRDVPRASPRSPARSVPNRPPPRTRLVGGHHLDRDRPLVRVHPDHHPRCVPSTRPPLLEPLLVVEPGGHRYFELSKPLLSLSLPWRRPARAGQMRATRPSVGSRYESDSPGAWTEPRQAPVLRSMKQVADERAFATQGA